MAFRHNDIDTNLGSNWRILRDVSCEVCEEMPIGSIGYVYEEPEFDGRFKYWEAENGKWAVLKISNMTEEQLQAKCFTWFWNMYPQERQMVFHIDNNSVNSIAGNKKRTAGVTKGISDFIFVVKGGRVIFVEMKLPLGTQKHEQREFERKCLERKHSYCIVRTTDQFVELTRACFGAPLKEDILP